MTRHDAIELQMTVQNLLDSFPPVARVFIDRRMACVGCAIARFETIEEVARTYGQNPEGFRTALLQCAGRSSVQVTSKRKES